MLLGSINLLSFVFETCVVCVCVGVDSYVTKILHNLCSVLMISQHQTQRTLPSPRACKRDEVEEGDVREEEFLPPPP